MALNLRKAIIRNGVITGGLCLVLSVALSAFTGGMNFSLPNLVWPLFLAAGIGGFTAWQVAAKIKSGVLSNLPQAFSYAQLTRGAPVNGIAIQWDAIDDYAIQLEARGYTRLGDFTTFPLPQHFVGVATCFVDRDATTLVEVQHIQISAEAIAATRADPGGLHFSIVSMLGGNITATTTDHTVMASNYLIRGENSAVATFPGLGLLPLLDKHARLLAHLRERCGKTPMPGLNMHRYILLHRERFAQVRKRVQALSGYQIAQQIDAFEAAPRTNWATSSAILAALPERPFAELDSSEYVAGQPTIVMLDGDAAVATATATGDTVVAGETIQNDANASARMNVLRRQIEGSAGWFYWVAALSLINAVIAVLGSNWSFVIGLGIPQLLVAFAGGTHVAGGSMGLGGVMLLIASLAIPLFFAACGWFARGPSVVAFVVGTLVFVLDSMIFVIAGDWVGVAFHALVLYFLWNGIVAAREYKRMVSR